MLSFDLSQIPEDRTDGTEYYLDDCRLNHAANQKPVESIIDRLIQPELLQMR